MMGKSVQTHIFWNGVLVFGDFETNFMVDSSHMKHGISRNNSFVFLLSEEKCIGVHSINHV